MTTERIVRDFITQTKSINASGRRGIRTAEMQDVLSSIHKLAYPHISRARKLNDLNKQIELFQTSSLTSLGFLTLRLLPEHLPMWRENNTQLYLGIRTEHDGSCSAIKVKVWREQEEVYCECPHLTRSTKIVSESEAVFVTLSCCYQPTIEVSSPSKGYLKFSLVPELLPKGQHDKPALYLKSVFDGEKNFITQVNVWRDENNVHTECEHMKVETPIKSETEEVAILQPICCIAIDATASTDGILKYSIFPKMLPVGREVVINLSLSKKKNEY